MFKKVVLNQLSYEDLSNVTFEDIAKGRKGAVLVDRGDIPLVRTTTVYNNPPQEFLPAHYDLVTQIEDACGLARGAFRFNNALIEIYDDTYYKMGYHTDQSLDLENDSYICLVSCYELAPEHLRVLQIQNKTTHLEQRIELENNSAVVFSTEANHKHVHKIVLDYASNTNWLGITFRVSKTLVTFVNDAPYIRDGLNQELTALRKATNEERREFYRHKRLENENIGYTYPDIEYTLSDSDLKQSVSCNHHHSY